ncbi:MAG: M15 family metallopeptidase [Treponema sp.]|nr:M15 family metallopeptidase [Treponema sp.]
MIHRMWRGFFALLFLPLWTVCGLGRSETQVLAALPIPAQELPDPGEEEAPTMSWPETIMRALAQAYPDRIGEVAFYQGDWTITVYGERFFYAEGRMLPEALRYRYEEYNPLPFNASYPRELPPWTAPSAEESARLREMDPLRQASRGQTPRRRPNYFYEALWRARNQNEAYERVKTIRFLGHQVMVHNSILTQLSLVEEEIRREAQNSGAVRTWIANLGNPEGWFWRNIAATENRSFHAYGAAIDLMPRNLGNQQVYWQWTAQHTPDWWTVPYNRRYHPPDVVIRAFEKFGFTWGGKWRFFDTMHFEYRPEILILSGMAPMDLRDLR